jgi:hypothetical protein
LQNWEHLSEYPDGPMEGLEYIMPRVQLRDKNDALMDAYHDIYMLRLIHVVLQT